MIYTNTTFKRSFFLCLFCWTCFRMTLTAVTHLPQLKPFSLEKTHGKEKEEKGDDGNISGEKPEAPKVTTVSVFLVRRKKKREKSSRSKTRALMSAGGSSYITEEPTMHGFFQQTQTPQKNLPTVNHTETLAGRSAHRHMNTCARFASWRSCFREVNCVTVGGDTSVLERPLVESWQTTRLLFHMSINASAA